MDKISIHKFILFDYFDICKLLTEENFLVAV